MGWADRAIAELQKGHPAIVVPHGTSMMPRIRSGDRVVIRPLGDHQTLYVGDAVLVRIRGRVMLHQISAIDGDRVQISNYRGHVNGWVNRQAVYGVAEA